MYPAALKPAMTPITCGPVPMDSSPSGVSMLSRPPAIWTIITDRIRTKTLRVSDINYLDTWKAGPAGPR